MERSSKRQIHIDAAPAVVWDLLGDPNRHSEWWPRMADVECADLEQGCRYRGVVKGPLGRSQGHEFLVERLEECSEVSIVSEGTGVFSRFELAEARGGTFVEGCFGARPQSLGMRVFGAVAGQRYLRAWLERSLAALKEAAERRVPAA
jgi:carbon monoxide dehydrogenase subunit G